MEKKKSLWLLIYMKTKLIFLLLYFLIKIYITFITIMNSSN